MAENGEIAQAFAPQHRKLQAFMVTFSQHFRVLLDKNYNSHSLKSNFINLHFGVFSKFEAIRKICCKAVLLANL